MKATWILVADRARARLFTPGADGHALVELKDFINPEGVHPAQAYGHERAPRTHERMGPARHAIEPHSTPEEKAAERFAHALVETLERGRVEHRFERLLLVAPPHFLGTLERVLGRQLRHCVAAQLDQDLTMLSPDAIQSRVAPLYQGPMH